MSIDKKRGRRADAWWAAAAVKDYVTARTTRKPGADFMVDVFQSLGFEYVFANPASSFMAIHESIIGHAGNRNPEFITCTHEELSVAMADGYAKIAGRPAMVCAHGTVGLQHAAMAVYNAYCDRVPVYIVLGNTADAAARHGRVDWVHSAQDPAAMVRDFIKWSDQPGSLEHFAESAVRAYEIAMTPPQMPVVLVADTVLQQKRPPLDFAGHIPRLQVPSPPHGDPSSIRDAARALVHARCPVIVAGRVVKSPEGMRGMVELADLLQAGVVDEFRRLNFPSRHPLNQTASKRAAIESADVVLALEADDLFGAVHRLHGQLKAFPRPITAPGTRIIRMGLDAFIPASNYQNRQRHQEAHLSLAADAEATLPSLLEAVRREIGKGGDAGHQARGARWQEATCKARERANLDARRGWDASPVTTARLCTEIWNAVRRHDWSLVSFTRRVSDWPLRLWDFTAPHQYIGGAGGEGVGYIAPAAAGAALANRRDGRLSIAIQTDGDLLSSSGVLWTLAHHRIPLLMVMHNNRAYAEEVRHLRHIARRHARGLARDRYNVGTTIDDPNVDFAGLARSMGVEAEGPITDPAGLAAVLQRGVTAVQQGRPYLIDVLTQPR
jgi:thiamine pyrophosphate-dependent acetolactate synthase large subunit-like protein